MWSELLANIARVFAPRAKASDGSGEVCVAVTSTNDVMVVPTWMRGKYCEFTAVTESVDVLFGTSAAEVVVAYGAESSIDGSDVVTVNATTGRHIASGTSRSWIVPKDATYMGWEGSGTGKLYVGIASLKIVR